MKSVGAFVSNGVFVLLVVVKDVIKTYGVN